MFCKNYNRKSFIGTLLGQSEISLGQNEESQRKEVQISMGQVALLSQRNLCHNRCPNKSLGHAM